MKMANIDAVFDFMFTNPKNLDGVSVYNNIIYSHYMYNLPYYL